MILLQNQNLLLSLFVIEDGKCDSNYCLYLSNGESGTSFWHTIASYSEIDYNIPFLAYVFLEPSCRVFVKIIGTPEKQPAT